MAVIAVSKYLTGDIKITSGKVPLTHRIAFNLLLRKIANAAKTCGEKWHVNDGYRPYADQVKARNLYLFHNGPLAAVPGQSNHGFGKAADVQPVTGGTVGGSMKRRLALKKFGLCLPVEHEPWHIEIGSVWHGGAKP